METNALVCDLVGAFNRRKPVRAGSLIVTLYGDAIVPRGGSLSLGDIARIMELFRIDGGHVRTAISRLTTEKWLERKKVGRNTFYKLSKRGEGAFAEATKRIYFARKADTAKVRLALLNGEAANRAAQRNALEAAGFAPFNALSYVSADGAPAPLKIIKGIHLLDLPASAEAVEILRAAYKLDDLAERYREFIALFRKLHDALKRGVRLSDTDALTVRLLLIQEFRRAVLRDPALPSALLPAGWPGEEARALAASIYKKVLTASERQLDQCQADETHTLPKPNISLSQRFAAAQ
ncbi:MAG: phenylacetic acid degradation operon negative regulatory protein PaaX [Xanthobacteraceae bacterium]|nr:phenylacetic acid degradation operon negative regulatory protein PaaX [Xanthobacteraceae bacterium]MBX3522063.1 phenylacetic acid degradation operon negative regulatory protein PaaX [Xanthobacteraceae bacterium]MCW5674031.1 phenylacetic acid degradation operon negative regulatory protein PaaX [Xanthobacteraceae bacterium]